MYQVTKEKEKLVIKRYVLHRQSANEIAKLECIDRKTVFRILKRNNLKSRTLAEATLMYSCNDNYFEKIDTEEKAYWLGALYADGNVSTNGRNSGLVFLSQKDYDWINKFLRCIQSTNKPVREFHKKFKTEIWKARITSLKMFNDLVSLGCVPRKSLIIEFPKLHLALINHFIRGYFDGDGTVGVYRNLTTHSWKILKSGFCSGSECFLKELVEYLPVKTKTIYKNHIYNIKFSLRDSILLYEYMYKDASVYLERKHNIFVDYISSYKPRKRFNDYNKLS